MFNRYLSNHPGLAQRLAAYQGTTAAPSYLTSFPVAQNYSSAYQARYMKNLAKYQNYLATHPGLAANQGIGSVPYLPGYAGQYPYPDPTQQLASNPIMPLVAPFMPSYPGLQNYPGGYGVNAPPVYQPSYAGSSYPPLAQWGDDDDDYHWHRSHHHHFDDDCDGPYGGGAYGPYRGGSYGPYGRAPIAQAWNHHHFQRNFGPAAQFNRQQFFRVNTGPNRGWMTRPFSSMGHHGMWDHHR